MAATNRYTLLDQASLAAPDGNIAPVIAKVLELMAPMLRDGPAYPANGEMAEKVTLQNSLPTIQAARLNKGTPRSKGGFTSTNDTIAWYDARSEFDPRIAMLKGAKAVAEARRRFDDLFIEKFAQVFEALAFYGNELLNPEDFTGLERRLRTLATAVTGSQVRSMGTYDTDSTSIYIVDWHRDWNHFIYPVTAPEVGVIAGLKAENKGEQPTTDDDGNTFEVEVTKFNFMLGFTNKDPRHIARLANIDLSDAALEVPTQGLITRKLNQLFANMPKPTGGTRVMYSHRDLEAHFWNQAVDKPNNLVSIGEFLGEPILTLRGYPLRGSDQISAAESEVT